MKKIILLAAATLPLLPLDSLASNSSTLDLHFMKFNEGVTSLRRSRRGQIQRTAQEVSRLKTAYNQTIAQKVQIDRQLTFPGQENSPRLHEQKNNLTDQLSKQYDELFHKISELFLEAHRLSRPVYDFGEQTASTCAEGMVSDVMIRHLVCDITIAVRESYHRYIPARGHGRQRIPSRYIRDTRTTITYNLTHLSHTNLPPHTAMSGNINDGELVLETSLGVDFTDAIAIDDQLKETFITSNQELEIRLGFHSCVVAHFSQTTETPNLFCSSYDLITNQTVGGTFRNIVRNLADAHLIVTAAPPIAVGFWAARMRRLYQDL